MGKKPLKASAAKRAEAAWPLLMIKRSRRGSEGFMGSMERTFQYKATKISTVERADPR
jgi:hypothetical protein